MKQYTLVKHDSETSKNTFMYMGEVSNKPDYSFVINMKTGKPHIVKTTSLEVITEIKL